MNQHGTPTPQHIAFIMDGNGRWANAQGKTRIAGHKKGVETLRNVVEWCGELGIQYVTVFAFSSENWSRPASEVRVLMELLASTLEKDTPILKSKGIQVRFIGDESKLSIGLRNQMKSSVMATQSNNRLVLTLAINYGGRWDIVEAGRKCVQAAINGEITPDAIDEEYFSSFMAMCEAPDPDLVIRTSGECRISNFLLWQIAYSEFYFSDMHWPEFDRNELVTAIKSFSQRDRRFGGAVIDKPRKQTVAAHLAD